MITWAILTPLKFLDVTPLTVKTCCADSLNVKQNMVNMTKIYLWRMEIIQNVNLKILFDSKCKKMLKLVESGEVRKSVNFRNRFF
ncbi:hypothetical protein JN11_00802 [Mucilaginibacter frigoritolerans]|uniref:Uncharacterized protein n=1 Tax=Mucilaginibacter frigoritolerans TaxID=652788 RepID=A0A562UDC6_9SPHI|nr:hypothetical protein JN11_00802 [Mucilaginibacter frigoritolerans]